MAKYLAIVILTLALVAIALAEEKKEVKADLEEAAGHHGHGHHHGGHHGGHHGWGHHGHGHYGYGGHGVGYGGVGHWGWGWKNPHYDFGYKFIAGWPGYGYGYIG